MGAEVGIAVSDILERAGERHLGNMAPEWYQEYLWQLHGAGKLREYDGSDVYWRRIQAALDFFFTAEQRAQICDSLLSHISVARLPESRSFRASALAEARTAELIAACGLPDVRRGHVKAYRRRVTFSAGPRAAKPAS